MRPGQEIAVEATGLDADGRGIAQFEGGRVLVGDLLPKERARVRVEHVSSHRPVAWARLVERLSPTAAERVAPPCPNFGRCGGCPWQHLAYPAQLEHKRRRVADALTQALGEKAPPVMAVVAAPSTLGYRNKGKYVVARLDGRLVLGSYRPRSHEVIDMAGCRVVAPVIDEVAGLVREALERSGLEVYDERRRRGHARYVVVRANGAGRVLIVLVTTSDAPRGALQPLAEELAVHSSVDGVVWCRNDSRAGAVLSDDIELLAGDPFIKEEVAGVTVDVGATEFWQVNTEQAERLYAAVAELGGAGPGKRAVDLYSGLGGIAFSLARAGADVIGIERQPAAVAAATRAAAAVGFADRVRFEVGDPSELGTLAPNADLIVVDPPRKGLGAAGRAALTAVRPAAIVYVSCGPESLARDLQHLDGAGYAVDRVQPYDLMPGTAQVETVAVCRARSSCPV